jgi:hypothetical protein
MLRWSHLLSHMTRSCTASSVSSLVASFFRPGRSSLPMLSLPHLHSAAHFSQCYTKGVSFPSVSMKSSWISLWDIPFLQGYLTTALILTFSNWSKWHAPLLIKVCFRTFLLKMC